MNTENFNTEDLTPEHKKLFEEMRQKAFSMHGDALLTEEHKQEIMKRIISTIQLLNFKPQDLELDAAAAGVEKNPLTADATAHNSDGRFDGGIVDNKPFNVDAVDSFTRVSFAQNQPEQTPQHSALDRAYFEEKYHNFFSTDESKKAWKQFKDGLAKAQTVDQLFESLMFGMMNFPLNLLGDYLTHLETEKKRMANETKKKLGDNHQKHLDKRGMVEQEYLRDGLAVANMALEKKNKDLFNKFPIDKDYNVDRDAMRRTAAENKQLLDEYAAIEKKMPKNKYKSIDWAKLNAPEYQEVRKAYADLTTRAPLNKNGQIDVEGLKCNADMETLYNKAVREYGDPEVRLFIRNFNEYEPNQEDVNKFHDSADMLKPRGMRPRSVDDNGNVLPLSGAAPRDNGGNQGSTAGGPVYNINGGNVQIGDNNQMNKDTVSGSYNNTAIPEPTPFVHATVEPMPSSEKVPEHIEKENNNAQEKIPEATPAKRSIADIAKEHRERAAENPKEISQYRQKDSRKTLNIYLQQQHDAVTGEEGIRSALGVVLGSMKNKRAEPALKALTETINKYCQKENVDIKRFNNLHTAIQITRSAFSNGELKKLINRAKTNADIQDLINRVRDPNTVAPAQNQATVPQTKDQTSRGSDTAQTAQNAVHVHEQHTSASASTMQADIKKTNIR